MTSNAQTATNSTQGNRDTSGTINEIVLPTYQQ